MLDFLKPRVMDLNFVNYIEPEEGINTPEEFERELLHWADRNGRQLQICSLSMEPEVTLEGKRYLCRLASPGLASQKAVKKTLLPGYSQPAAFLGYKWIYLYEA